jgi:hypothetical protein
MSKRTGCSPVRGIMNFVVKNDIIVLHLIHLLRLRWIGIYITVPAARLGSNVAVDLDLWLSFVIRDHADMAAVYHPTTKEQVVLLPRLLKKICNKHGFWFFLIPNKQGSVFLYDNFC